MNMCVCVCLKERERDATLKFRKFKRGIQTTNSFSAFNLQLSFVTTLIYETFLELEVQLKHPHKKKNAPPQVTGFVWQYLG